MINTLLLYFGVNTILALILWFAGIRETKVSVLGFFLAMVIFGVPILILLCVAFLIAILTGASYNFGTYLEGKFKKVL